VYGSSTDNKPFGVVSLTDILRKLSQWLHESSMGGGSFGGSKVTSGEMKGETRARSGSSGMKESLPHHGGGSGGIGHEQARHHIPRSEQQDHDKQELMEHHFDPKSVKLGGDEAPMDLSGIFDPQQQGQQQQGQQGQKQMKKAKAHHASRMEQQDHDKSELMEGHSTGQPAVEQQQQPQSQSQSHKQPHVSRIERQDHDKSELLGLSDHEIHQRKTDDKMASRGTTLVGSKCAAGVGDCTCVGTCTCQQKVTVEQQKVGKGLQHASGKGVNHKDAFFTSH